MWFFNLLLVHCVACWSICSGSLCDLSVCCSCTVCDVLVSFLWFIVWFYLFINLLLVHCVVCWSISSGSLCGLLICCSCIVCCVGLFLVVHCDLLICCLHRLWNMFVHFLWFIAWFISSLLVHCVLCYLLVHFLWFIVWFVGLLLVHCVIFCSISRGSLCDLLVPCLDVVWLCKMLVIFFRFIV